MTMSHEVSIRQGAAALGAAGLLALSLAGPAMARQDPGGGAPEPPSQRSSACHYLNQCDASGGAVPRTQPRTIAIDDNALEYLQLGAGVMTGLALGGAGVLLVRRHGHGHPSPA